MNCLVLFSGTGSIEKVFNSKKYNIRGLDIDNTFKPYYNEDILKWDYKKEFKTFIPDFIHSSPVCCEFSKLKNINQKSRDMELGLSLLHKTLEIIEYVKTINHKLKYTIENPKGLMRKQECMKPYKMITTSYCKYGFPYQKDTDFWFGGFKLKLKPRCRNTKKDQTPWCESKNKYKCHRVRLGLSNKKDSGTYKRTNKNQIGDNEYFKELRKTDEYKYNTFKFTDTFFRFRIPKGLCEEIRDSLVI